MLHVKVEKYLTVAAERAINRKKINFNYLYRKYLHHFFVIYIFISIYYDNNILAFLNVKSISSKVTNNYNNKPDIELKRASNKQL